VDTRVVCRFVHRLSHAHGGGMVEDHLHALQGMAQRSCIQQVALDHLDPWSLRPVGNDAVDLRIHDVEHPHPMTPLGQDRCQVGSDESGSASQEDLLGGHVFPPAIAVGRAVSGADSSALSPAGRAPPSSIRRTLYWMSSTSCRLAAMRSLTTPIRPSMSPIATRMAPASRDCSLPTGPPEVRK